MSTNHHARPHLAVRGIVVGALLALVPASVIAQATNGHNGDQAKADALHAKAEKLIAKQAIDDWKEAARLFESAARLRAPDETVGIRERMLAGELQHYVGSLNRAQANLQDAAELALSNGRVLESAQLFLRAAFVARERDAWPDVARYIESAQRLAASPHLSQAECDCILERLQTESRIAVEARRGGG